MRFRRSDRDGDEFWYEAKSISNAVLNLKRMNVNAGLFFFLSEEGKKNKDKIKYALGLEKEKK